MENQLITLFRQVTSKHRAVVQNYLDDYDLYIGQPRFLSTLKRNPGITQKELVEILNVSKESVSVTVKRLEAVGYIKRAVSESDRREKHLFLSDKGEQLVLDFTEGFERIDTVLFQSLTESQREDLAVTFKIMLDDLEKELER
ncbi:MarR family winged helix-turn-helix transcriptional regulator [Erysipelothrix aquatica]|uniref:MarR family winged helix-turn-helix transcriptional regulator n=1 Tax=Erysipelothrix aquatica TaxID=2683714 RepID=UPI001356D903|nr:MarR family transcriptional regulator [Erysipelothrix aquatica]